MIAGGGVRAVLEAMGVRASSFAVEALDAALIICADHELTPATFAGRVAASLLTAIGIPSFIMTLAMAGS